MSYKSTHKNQGTGWLTKRLKTFAAEEDGVFTIFVCFMIMITVVFAGIGVDLMRLEMERTRLQSVSDRAVLAAADLDQSMNPDLVVQDYFAKSGMATSLASVSVDKGINYRTVTVDSSIEVAMPYLRHLGYPFMIAPARAQAKENVPKLEISLVLDVSSSMKGAKLLDMQTAAKEFVDVVLADQPTNNTSVSLVPYSEQVNVGTDIFDALWVDTRHGFSHCIDVPDGHFVQTQMTPGFPWDQTQHMQWTDTGFNDLDNTICPRTTVNGVVRPDVVRPISQDKVAIKNQIDALLPRAGTAIYMGMKWGTALLDPSFRTTTEYLVGNGKVDATFANRPVSYDDSQTLKAIVLMSDGQNADSYRLQQSAYNSPSEYVHWANNNVPYWLKKEVPEKRHHQFTYLRYSAYVSDQLTDKICDAAKTEGIIIWTVAFGSPAHGVDTLRRCASSESHFFDTNTEITIAEAFKLIGGQLNYLRLTQ